MTRSALLIVAAVSVATAGGVAVCAAAGWPVRAATVATAAVTGLLAGAAAMVPLVLTRGATQPAVAQAGLVGTVVHLFGCLVGAAVLLLGLKQGAAAVYWILAVYWATLAAVVVECARAVRAAPRAGPAVPAAPKQ